MTVINHFSIIISIQVFCGHKFLTDMGKYQGICMVAGSYNKSMFSFISGYKLFSEVAIQFLNLFSSSIVDLQSCVNFCCTLK